MTNEATGAVVFEPPPHDDVPGLADELCDALEQSAWHPAVAAAWLHVAIAAVHPFRDGNGRTARVLASLAMYRGGFRHAAFTSLEEWWGRHAQSYYDAFTCLGRSFDRDTDVTAFVRTHVDAQLQQVRVLGLRQRTEGELYTTLENLLDDLSLPERLANALYDSFFGRDVTTAYYKDLIDLSQATARKRPDRRGCRRSRRSRWTHARAALPAGTSSAAPRGADARLERDSRPWSAAHRAGSPRRIGGGMLDAAPRR